MSALGRRWRKSLREWICERESKFVEGTEKQRKPRASASQSVVQFHCGSAWEKDDLTFNILIEQVQNFTFPFIEPHFIRSFFLKNIHRSREIMPIPMLHFHLSIRTLQNRKYSTFLFTAFSFIQLQLEAKFSEYEVGWKYAYRW